MAATGGAPPATDVNNVRDSEPHTSRPSVDMDICDEKILAVNPVTLSFKAAAVEGEYLADVAKRRWPVLIFIFSFDILCFTFRLIAKCIHVSMRADGFKQAVWDGVRDLGPQLANMGVLHCFLGLLNLRSRRHGRTAALQEEALLSGCMAAAICSLLAGLRPDNAADYVYAAFFLICTSTFMKIRWWVGTATLLLPTALVHVWRGSRGGPPLPEDAVVHMVVAWAVGGLMAYLADWYRRQMFANQKLVGLHHQKEILEAQARIKAQRELVEAQAQAAARALTVAREKAANEAKSEFMSLMCHEVRTPLNGCLASAEMLLETPLQEEQRELANTIRISGSILLSTVSNFLDFFKMEAGKRLDIVRAPLATADLVADVHCIIEAMIGRNGDVQLLDPDLAGIPPAIFGDADRLRGILLNLYTNAAKFTKQGHIGLRVRVVGAGYQPPSPPGYSSVTVTPSYSPGQPGGLGALAAGAAAAGAAAGGGKGGWLNGAGPSGLDSEVSGGEEEGPARGPREAAGCAPAAARAGAGAGAGEQEWLLFEVEDTGVGITDRGLKTLFREYVQGADDDLKTPRSKGGTGLGLSICSKQVGVLGGRIGAHSAVARGSVFWFTIPLIDVPPAEALRIPRAHSWASHSPAIVLAPASPTATAAPPSSTPSCPRCHSENNLQPHAQLPPRLDLPPALELPPRHDALVGTSAAAASSSSPIPSPADTPGPPPYAGQSTVTVAPRSPAPGSLPAASRTSPPPPPSPSATTGSGPRPPRSTPPPLAPPLPVAAPLESAGSASDTPPSPDSTPPYSPHPETHDSAGSLDGSSDDVSTNASAPCTVPTTGPPTATPSDCTPLAPPAALPSLLTQPHPRHPATHPPYPTAAAPPGGPQTRRQSIEVRATRGDWSALGGRRVLLAEDNLINQTVARKMLTSLGLQCEVASNGLEAVKAVERALQPHATPIDVVLMDMAMPIMGGLEATRAIRGLGAKVPIVAMTANAADKDRDECLAAGMDGFLSKPVLRERLAEAIGIVLSGRAWFQDSPLPLKAFEAL